MEMQESRMQTWVANNKIVDRWIQAAEVDSRCSTGGAEARGACGSA